MGIRTKSSRDHDAIITIVIASSIQNFGKRLLLRSTTFRDSVASHVARLLKEAREKRGISKTVLAAKAGISQSMVTYVEAEERNPSLEVLLRLTEALDVELSGILRNAEDLARHKSGTTARNK